MIRTLLLCLFLWLYSSALADQPFTVTFHLHDPGSATVIDIADEEDIWLERDQALAFTCSSSQPWSLRQWAEGLDDQRHCFILNDGDGYPSQCLEIAYLNDTHCGYDAGTHTQEQPWACQLTRNGTNQTEIQRREVRSIKRPSVLTNLDDGDSTDLYWKDSSKVELNCSAVGATPGPGLRWILSSSSEDSRVMTEVQPSSCERESCYVDLPYIYTMTQADDGKAMRCEAFQLDSFNWEIITPGFKMTIHVIEEQELGPSAALIGGSSGAALLLLLTVLSITYYNRSKIKKWWKKRGVTKSISGAPFPRTPSPLGEGSNVMHTFTVQESPHPSETNLSNRYRPAHARIARTPNPGARPKKQGSKPERPTSSPASLDNLGRGFPEPSHVQQRSRHTQPNSASAARPITRNVPPPRPPRKPAGPRVAALPDDTVVAPFARSMLNDKVRPGREPTRGKPLPPAIASVASPEDRIMDARRGSLDLSRGHIPPWDRVPSLKNFPSDSAIWGSLNSFRSLGSLASISSITWTRRLTTDSTASDHSTGAPVATINVTVQMADKSRFHSMPSVHSRPQVAHSNRYPGINHSHELDDQIFGSAQ